MGEINFDENNTCLKMESTDWRSAIRLAAGILEKNGFTKPSYADGIIESLEEFGPYIIIGPEIAIPHARPEKGALDMGYGLVTFKEPVYFDGEDGPEPVKVLIPFSAVDNNKHLELLQKIVKFLDDETIIEKIANANTVEELNQVIG